MESPCFCVNPLCNCFVFHVKLCIGDGERAAVPAPHQQEPHEWEALRALKAKTTGLRMQLEELLHPQLQGAVSMSWLLCLR